VNNKVRVTKVVGIDSYLLDATVINNGRVRLVG